MKLFLTMLMAGFLAAGPVYAAEEKKEAETAKVCVDVQGKDGKPVIDPKTKKPKQECKTVKKHQKHEGTKVPDAKK
jgi:hypothetical protein